MKFLGDRKPKRLFRQRGLTLIESALVLAVAAITMGFFVRMLADNAEVMRAKGVSEKMVEVFDASAKYVKVNNAALVEAIPPGGQIVVPMGKPGATSPVPPGPTGSLPSVQGGGFLSPGFIDRNSYNQRHALIIRNVTISGLGQRLDSIVTTYGGTKIPDRQLTKIAAFIGAAGGYVPKTPMAADTGQIVGSYGGWRSPRASWGSTSNPDEGSVVATLAFEAGEDGIAPYLYRNDIGKAEANRMHTSIDMFQNDLNNTRTVNAGNVRATENVEASKDLVAGIDIWAARNITAGGTVQGTNVVATNLVSAPTVNATTVNGTTVNSTNVNASGTVTGTNVTANANLTSNGNATVAGRTNTGDFHTTYFDAANTWVYNIRGIPQAAPASLDSLLPRQIAMYSYLVYDGQWVPKPSCPTNSGPRIMLYRQQDSTRGATILTGLIVDGFSQTGYADTADGIYAYHVTDYAWAVAWGGGFAAVPGVPRTAVAQTFCVYG
jgi:hypothetical protein